MNEKLKNSQLVDETEKWETMRKEVSDLFSSNDLMECEVRYNRLTLELEYRALIDSEEGITLTHARYVEENGVMVPIELSHTTFEDSNSAGEAYDKIELTKKG